MTNGALMKVKGDEGKGGWWDEEEEGCEKENWNGMMRGGGGRVEGWGWLGGMCRQVVLRAWKSVRNLISY